MTPDFSNDERKVPNVTLHDLSLFVLRSINVFYLIYLDLSILYNEESISGQLPNC